MRYLTLICAFSLTLFLTSCSMCFPNDFVAEVLPSPSAKPPLLAVHIVDENAVVHMDIETYVAGVVAGEMPNTWPMEALKAQAILARTFVLKFVTEKESRYPGADISTDITEAQAYNAAAINERILHATQETAGVILLTDEGALPYTWFHSHSGGMTETAVNGIDWQGEELAYIISTTGREADLAPWEVAFTLEEFIAACRQTGANITACNAISISKRGKSGRAVTLLVDGTPVNAARLRISLGSAKMCSTLLTSLSIRDGNVYMTGRGYGHGVGMSQWGAHELAQQGWTAEQILFHYYRNLQLVRAW